MKSILRVILLSGLVWLVQPSVLWAQLRCAERINAGLLIEVDPGGPQFSQYRFVTPPASGDFNIVMLISEDRTIQSRGRARFELEHIDTGTRYPYDLSFTVGNFSQVSYTDTFGDWRFYDMNLADRVNSPLETIVIATANYFENFFGDELVNLRFTAQIDQGGQQDLIDITFRLSADRRFFRCVPPEQLGDYNDDGIVNQADLDHVLFNWGMLKQEHLDAVLLNWGSQI